MADGVWTLGDDGEFTLMEPYATMLYEAKVAATEGWCNALIGYLAGRVRYPEERLSEELLRRSEEADGTPMEVLEEFVLEALSGDL